MHSQKLPVVERVPPLPYFSGKALKFSAKVMWRRAAEQGIMPGETFLSGRTVETGAQGGRASVPCPSPPSGERCRALTSGDSDSACMGSRVTAAPSPLKKAAPGELKPGRGAVVGAGRASRQGPEARPAPQVNSTDGDRLLS